MTLKCSYSLVIRFWPEAHWFYILQADQKNILMKSFIKNQNVHSSPHYCQKVVWAVVSCCFVRVSIYIHILLLHTIQIGWGCGTACKSAVKKVDNHTYTAQMCFVWNKTCLSWFDYRFKYFLISHTYMYKHIMAGIHASSQLCFTVFVRTFSSVLFSSCKLLKYCILTTNLYVSQTLLKFIFSNIFFSMYFSTSGLVSQKMR